MSLLANMGASGFHGSASPFRPRTARKYYTAALIGLALFLLYTISHHTPDTQRRVRAAYSAFRSPDKFSGAREEPPAPATSPEDIHLSPMSTHGKGAIGQGEGNYTATIVSGRLAAQTEEVKWIHDLQNITDKAIYIVDDPSAEHHLEKNHGREAMVYLTYIVDNYDKLNDITFFFHTQEYAWHNNLLMDESSAQSINRMNRSFVMEQGYVNTRCDHWPGCPDWVIFHPSAAEHALDPHRLSDMFSPKLFGKLFPNESEFPRYFAQACCSQFAASRDAIRNVPLAEWQRLKQWIEDDWLDQYTGRAMEMMWQYIFKRKGIHCPSMESCYCKQYGICIDENSDKEGLAILHRWNELRTRSEELQWQMWFRSDQLHSMTDKVWNYNERDDEEYARVEDERLEIGERTAKWKAKVMKHFGIEKSQVDW